jgi:hypothetical protein
MRYFSGLRILSGLRNSLESIAKRAVTWADALK